MKSASALYSHGLVIADTCIWIDAEKDPDVAAILIELATQDRLVMCGIVYAEILRGLQDAAIRERRGKQLLALQWVETPPEAWQQTAALARTQDRAGHPIPLTDAHVAALCVGNELALWTTDRHFEYTPSVRRFKGKM